MKARLPKGYGRPDPQAMMRQVQKPVSIPAAPAVKWSL